MSSAPAGQPLLRVEDLHLTFTRTGGAWGRVVESVPALQGAACSVDAGETLALVGESGCGKSTAARCVVGLLQPDRGRILLDGRDLVPLRGEERRQTYRRIQMVFQDPFASLNPRQRLRAAVREPLRNFGIGTRGDQLRRVDALLDRVGVPPAWGERYPHELSGGQRQRIGIARALALDPDLVICDEAVSALDVSIQAQILDLLRALQEERGLSYLFITHDLAVVHELADRVCVMQDGRVVESGPTEQLFAEPQEAYTQRLLAAVPRLPEDAWRDTETAD